MAYENTMAIVETTAGPQQMVIGSLVKVGEAWRLLDAPRPVSDGTAVTKAGCFSRPVAAIG